MALLDQLLAGYGGGAPSFDAFDAAAAPKLDPADEADAARLAWAEKLKRQKRPMPEWGSDAQPVPYAQGIGLLSSGNLPRALDTSEGNAPGTMGDPGGAELPPSANDPMASEPVAFRGGVPLPRPRPVTPNTPASVPDQPTDVSSANVQPSAPLSLAPAAAGVPKLPQQESGMFGDGLIGKILRPENAPLLLSLAGGFAGAGSIGTGMRRAFSGAAPAAMQLQQNQLKQTSQAATYRAMLEKGVPPHEAIAATLDPNVMKAVAAKYFETKPPVIHDVKDALGGTTPMVFDPAANQGKGSWRDMQGNPVGGAGSAPGGTGAPQLLAPGVKFDSSLSGEDYLKQFSPEVNAAVKAYMNGDVLPSGNPRQNGIANFAKTVAQKYGQDMGIPVSDALFSERRKYRMELGSNTPNSAGGQAKAFNQAVEHADALATQIEKLGNYDPVGIPVVSRGINTAREALSTKQADISTQARTIGQTLAGEVGKLFSGQAGGGVHERELTRNRFNTVSSPRELAGALEGTLETMQGGLRALEQRRDQVLGPGSNVEFVNKDTQAKIARIREVINRLRSGQAAPPPPPSGKTGTGVQWSIVQ